ncbi:MAG: type VII secretion protein EssB, partial [Streptococcaceae bacterium]|nr:type VII secretion protein EssB [Streptococcaceae bacterium]
FWIYKERGDLQKALNLAQNNDDLNLQLLANIDLYDATKLDKQMDGAKKQKQLDDYKKEIDRLTKELEK